MSGLTQAAILYGVPYVLAVLTPGPRWLFAYVIACVAFFPTVMVLILMKDAEQRAFAGGVFFLYSITIFIPAMISGFLARVMMLAVGPFKKSPLVHIAIVLTVSLAYPVVMFAPKFLSDYVFRPTQPINAWCNGVTVRFRLAGQTLDVPAAPMFGITLPSKYRLADDAKHINFGFNRSKKERSQVREFCRHAKHAEYMPDPTALTVRAALGNRARKWLETKCSNPTGRYRELLCRPAVSATLPKGTTVFFYGLESQEDAEQWLGKEYKALATRIMDDRAKFLAPAYNGTPFNFAGDGVWVSVAPGLIGPSGQPFLLSCIDENDTRCAASGAYQNGLQVLFKFRPAPGKAQAESRRLYQRLGALVEALSLDAKQTAN